MNFFAALLLCLLCICAVPAFAAVEGGHRVGFKTLGLWQEHGRMRLDLAVWYPALRAPAELRYGVWSFRAARNAGGIGRYPLIILSHDSPATRFSHHESAAALAGSGFVVAAPTHHGDNMDDMRHLFTPDQIRARAGQIRAALDVLLGSPETRSLIDPKRIGIVGFGVGGTVALLLGGAELDGREWPLYCKEAEADDLYCAPWAAARMDALAASLPLGRPLGDARIKAVAAVAPAYGMLFTRESLRGLRAIPLVLWAERDKVNRFPRHAEALKARMPHPVDYAVIADADAFSLMSACPPVLARELPELCGRADPERRARIHRQLNRLLSLFFLERLGGISREEKTPPAPASASPGISSAPAASDGGTKKGKRKPSASPP
jgi:predicted dienelactone hydrolase